MCRPDIVLSPVPFLNIQAGRHPCVVHTYTGDDFIPNDVIINGARNRDSPLCVVVTGPNMGGKSTLMRQTGLIVILAQLVRPVLPVVLTGMTSLLVCRAAMFLPAAASSVQWTGYSPE